MSPLIACLLLYVSVILTTFTVGTSQSQTIDKVFTETPSATPTQILFPTVTPSPIPNRPPQVTFEYSINGGEAKILNFISSAILASRNDQVELRCHAIDPDGDSITATLYPGSIADAVLQSQKTDDKTYLFRITFRAVPADRTFTNSLQIGIASKVGKFTIPIRVVINNDTLNDDLILSQGYGGSSIIQVRNMDPNRGPVTQIIRSFRGASGKFAEAIGGAQRATYVSVGDINGDDTNDFVISFGPVSTETPAAVPNAVVVRDGKSLETIGNSFTAFPTGQSRSVEYNYGDIHTAVGNFTGTTPNQIAVAQGIGGNGIVRIFQYTGAQAPHSYRVVSQFLGLTSNVRTNNANGGLNISAGDVDGDGLDELLVSQSYSATSKSICNVLGFNANGEIEHRIGFTSFPFQYTSGGAGVRTTVCDTNGDGINEIVVAIQKGGANTISVCKPTIDNNRITGFSTSNIPIKVTLPGSVNPSGFLTIASGELDNNGENGDELLIGTDWVYEMKNGFVQYSLPAQFSAYHVTKPSYIFDQNIIYYLSPIYFFGSIQNIHAFLPPYNPTSGAVHVTAGRMH